MAPFFDYPVFHENFEEHQAAQDRVVVTEDEALYVWYGERQFFPNVKRPGAYLMRGLTAAGRLITVVVLPTADPSVWLLYTAW